MKIHQFQPDLPPPANTVGPIGWMRKNLFNGPVNSIVALFSLTSRLPHLEHFQLGNLQADWIGSTRDDCSENACWVFISVRWEQFMYGFYPQEELWRPRLFYATLAIFCSARL